MRILLNSGLIFILSATLVGAPVMAAPTNPVSAPAPLGVVVQADRATIGVDLTIGGATIYDGDRLETDANGTLRARLGGPQIYLRQDTSALVHGLPNGFSADLTHGTVMASSAEGQTFQILAVGVTIRPTSAQPTIAQVTWISANQLLLTSTRGSINVSLGNEVKTIDAGSSYRMEVLPETTDDPQQGTQHTGRNRNRMLWWLVAGVSVATGILLWRALESPCGL